MSGGILLYSVHYDTGPTFVRYAGSPQDQTDVYTYQHYESEAQSLRLAPIHCNSVSGRIPQAVNVLYVSSHAGVNILLMRYPAMQNINAQTQSPKTN